MSEKSEVLISIAIRNLPIGYFDSYYVTLRVATGGYFHDKDALSTERVEEDLNIEFRERLQLEYVFEEKQVIRAELYGLFNGDSACVSICECSVGRVIHSGGEMLKCSEWSWDKQIEEIEYLYVVAEDPASKDNLEIKMTGYGLDKKDLFGKSDPYVVIYRRTDRGKLLRTYRSEVVKNTLNPDWKPIVASLQKLCNNELDCELVFRCFDWDGANGDPEDLDTEFDELIGEFCTTTRDLFLNRGEEKKFELINPRKKRKKKNYQHSGLVTIKAVQTITSLTFLDYMFGGTDLNFIVAVDLTSSNGTVDAPSSFHFMDSENNNEYSVGIQAVLEILQEYDNDGLFPAFGFGARVPPDYKISHEYPLNGDYANPFCRGVNGVLDAYRESLKHVVLAGPTCFAPVLKQVANLAKKHKDGSHYFVLLILTDGSVDDWKETKRAVIETSYLPVSVIVIGIGGGRFQDMETLDQDYKLLRVGNEEACRDNVQFVQMRKYLRAAADGSAAIRWNKVSLAREVLAELPMQVVQYMTRISSPNSGSSNMSAIARRSQNLRMTSMRDMLVERQCSTTSSGSSGGMGPLNASLLASSAPGGSHGNISLPSTVMQLSPMSNPTNAVSSSSKPKSTSGSNARLRRCATSTYDEYISPHVLLTPPPESNLSPRSYEGERRLSSSGRSKSPSHTSHSSSYNTQETPRKTSTHSMTTCPSPVAMPRSSPNSPSRHPNNHQSNRKSSNTSNKMFPNTRQNRPVNFGNSLYP